MIGDFCVVCKNGHDRGSIEMRHEPSRFNPSGNPIGIHRGKCYAQYEESAQRYLAERLAKLGMSLKDFLPYPKSVT